jgi:hypothetical protein
MKSALHVGPCEEKKSRLHYAQVMTEQENG